MPKRFTKGSAKAYFLYAISFFMSLLTGLMIPVVPLLALMLGASQFDLGLIGSAAPVVYVPTTLIAGRFSDRFGRKPLVVISPLIYSLACLVYYFSRSPSHLMLAKVFDGIAMAMLWPPVEALLAEGEVLDSNRMVSNFSVSWSLGAAFGALISSAVIDAGRYFDVFVPASLFSLFFSLSSLVLISERGARPPQGSFSEIAKADPRDLRPVWAAAFLYAFCQGIVFALYPAHAQLRGMPGLVIGFAITLMMAGRTAVFFIFRRIRLSFRELGMMGSGLMGLSAVTLIYFPQPLFVLPFSLTFGVGTGLTYAASIRSALSDDVGRGKHAGLFEGSIGVGYLLGPAVGGPAAQIVMEGPYIICTAVCLMTFLGIAMSELT